jgi:hypothetical protein
MTKTADIKKSRRATAASLGLYLGSAAGALLALFLGTIFVVRRRANANGDGGTFDRHPSQCLKEISLAQTGPSTEAGFSFTSAAINTEPEPHSQEARL